MENGYFRNKVIQSVFNGINNSNSLAMKTKYLITKNILTYMQNAVLFFLSALRFLGRRMGLGGQYSRGLRNPLTTLAMSVRAWPESFCAGCWKRPS